VLRNRRPSDQATFEDLGRAGDEAYAVSKLICPCERAGVTVNGAFAEGEVRLDDSGPGGVSSSAFLAFPETCTQPAGAQ
jgi:hypothetical protein